VKFSDCPTVRPARAGETLTEIGGAGGGVVLLEPPQAVRKSAPEEHRAIVKSGTHSMAIFTKERAALKRFRMVLVMAGHYHTSTNYHIRMFERLLVGVMNINETCLCVSFWHSLMEC
jgi:hypothetical protein